MWYVYAGSKRLGLSLWLRGWRRDRVGASEVDTKYGHPFIIIIIIAIIVIALILRCHNWHIFKYSSYFGVVCNHKCIQMFILKQIHSTVCIYFSVCWHVSLYFLHLVKRESNLLHVSQLPPCLTVSVSVNQYLCTLYFLPPWITTIISMQLKATHPTHFPQQNSMQFAHSHNISLDVLVLPGFTFFAMRTSELRMC